MKNPKQRRIFLVGTDSAVSGELMRLLLEWGHAPTVFTRRADLAAALALEQPDLLVFVAGDSAESTLLLAGELAQSSPGSFVLLTTHWDENALRAGAEYGALAVLAANHKTLQHCIPMISAVLERDVELRQLRRRAELLTAALQRSRAISTATGLLMERLRLNQQRAFEVLRAAARARRVRLADFAESLLLSVDSLNAVQKIVEPSARSEKRDVLRSNVRNK